MVRLNLTVAICVIFLLGVIGIDDVAGNPKTLEKPRDEMDPTTPALDESTEDVDGKCEILVTDEVSSIAIKLDEYKSCSNISLRFSSDQERRISVAEGKGSIFCDTVDGKSSCTLDLNETDDKAVVTAVVGGLVAIISAIIGNPKGVEVIISWFTGNAANAAQPHFALILAFALLALCFVNRLY